MARVTLWGAVALAALFTLFTVTGGVSFDCPVPVNNDPLTNAVAVNSISGNRLVLADGRVLVMEGYTGDYLEREMRDSGNRVQLERANSGIIDVIVKKKRFICGTHSPRFVIPLVRREYPANDRHSLGWGELQ